MTTRRWLASASVVAALGVAAGAASAQPTESVRKADELFREGRALLDRGNLGEACPKFEESQRLDPGLGTLLNLADCYERTDRLASALTAFRNAEEQARSLGEKKRETVAADRARALEGRVSRVTITLAPGERPGGFAITRNGTAVAAMDLGRPIAVDPGTVMIEASAPGTTPFRKIVEVTATRTTSLIDIPQLAAGSSSSPGLPTPATATSLTSAPVPRRSTVDAGTGRRRLGYVVGGAGVLGLGTGIVLGVLAKHDYDAALEQYCGGKHDMCSPAGITEANQARDQGTFGTIVGGAGVAAIAVGAVLWLTAPSSRAVEVTPSVTPDGAGVTFAGRF